MDIFRRLGSGLSKLSFHKKGSSKSKSKARTYRGKTDGLTYSSPFGASFRHDPDSDLAFISFISPEKIASHRRGASSENPDGLEGSDSSFDRPFLNQTSWDDLGNRCQPTTEHFGTYWKLVRAGSDRIPDSESQQRKVVKGSESIELESMPDSQQSQIVVESDQRMKTSHAYYDHNKPVKSIDREDELGGKFHSQDTKRRTNADNNLLGGNLDSLGSSIEGLINSGLRFQSSCAIDFDPADELTSREDKRSKSLHRYLRSGASQNLRGARYWHHGDVHRARKPVGSAAQSLSLESIVGQSLPGDAAEEVEHNSLEGKRGFVRGRSSSLTKIDCYQSDISMTYSKRGRDSPANDTLEVPPTTQQVVAAEQQQPLGSVQLNFRLQERSVRKQLSTPPGKSMLGKRSSSELRNRRLAIMMCPRPYGRKNTVDQDDHTSFGYIRFSDHRYSPQCNGDDSETIRSYTKRHSERNTVRGLPFAEQEHSDDEFCKLSYTKSPANEDTPIVSVGLNPTLSPSSGGRRQVDRSFQAAWNSQNFSQIKSSDVPQRICKTVATEPCFATQIDRSESIQTFSSKGGGLQRLPLSKSVHRGFTTRLLETARPGDIWWKYPDLKDIKSSDPANKLAFVQSIISDDFPSEVPLPSMSTIAMTNPHPPGHNSVQPSYSQVSAAPHENTLKIVNHPVSYSGSIFCSKEAILRQSRKGWGNRSNGQDLD